MHNRCRALALGCGLAALVAHLPAQWTLRGASPAGNCIGAAYDEARGVTIAVFTTPALQTWAWNGTAWTHKLAAGFPGFSEDHGGALVYDRIGHRVLAAIAEGPSSNGGWMYAFDGQSWLGIAPVLPHPPGAVAIAAAFDDARGVVVAHVLNETWEWNGAWAQRAVTSSPGRLDHCRLVHDPLLQETLLVGGVTTNYVPGWGYQTNATTWSWNGMAWTARPTSFQFARVQHALAYDGTRGRAVAHGGASSFGGGPLWTQYVDTLSLGATNWAWMGALLTPANMLGSHLTTDLGRGCMVLVGEQTWEFVRAGAPTFAHFGAGCSGLAGITQLDLANGGMPWIGQNLELRASRLGGAGGAILLLGLSNTTWAGVPLPLPLPGTTGCDLVVSADLLHAAAAVGGEANFSVALPFDPALVGVALFGQSVVPDPSNPLGLVVSGGIAMQIGMQ